METLGIAIFFSVAILCLTLLMLRERKAEKRIWEWRELLIQTLHEISLVIENHK